MQAFTRIQGIAAALMRDNIDTDSIIASRDITSPSREGFADKLFAPWRYIGPGGPENPDFVLNRAPWRRAQVLIAGSNFGCGSSREMAVWALLQFGIRCVIAPSFGAIFRDNCVRNGLLPVVLPADQVARLATAAEGAALTLAVDLQAQTVQVVGGTLAVGTDAAAVTGTATAGLAFAFTFPAHDRRVLLAGLDAIDLTWQQRAQIEAFEAADRLARPWIWGL